LLYRSVLSLPIGLSAVKKNRRVRDAAVFLLEAGFQMEESGRFLKKAAQKLLLCRAMGCVSDNAHNPAQKVFASFCS
jgi:hypothetical protein